MSERQRLMYVESVSTGTVELNRHLMDLGTDGGIGIAGVTVTTVESTADPGFWGTTGSCSMFLVTFKKVQ